MFKLRAATGGRHEARRRSLWSSTCEPLEGRTLFSAYSLTTISALASRSDTIGSQTPVMFDSAGNLFGTIAWGGVNQNGAIFEIKAGTHVVTNVASVDADGGYDIVGMTLDAAGDVYVAINNSNTDDGRIAKLTPGANTLTPVAVFDTTTLGSLPDALTIDPAGNLYVLAGGGGANGTGAILEIAADNSVSRLASLDSTYAGLTLNSLVYANGNLYGTTLDGGVTSDGTVFELPAGASTVTTLGSFTRATTGSQITGAPYVDTAGNVFGVASKGSTNDAGDIWEIPSDGSGIQVLATFDTTVTYEPSGRLIPDGNGNLLGVTDDGPSISGPTDHPFGSIYQFSLSTHQITPIVYFDGNQGENPNNGLAEDSSGNLYGTTAIGGPFFNGELFEASTSAVVLPVDGSLFPLVSKTTIPADVVSGTPISAKLTIQITNDGLTVSKTIDRVEAFAMLATVSNATPISLGHVTKLLNLKPTRGTKVVINVKKLTLPAGLYTTTLAVTEPDGTVSQGSGGSISVDAANVTYTAAISTPVPTKLKAGQAATFALTVTNFGNVPGVGSATITIGLSTTEVATVTLPPITLKSLKVKPGSKTIVKLHVKLPSDLPAGSYFTFVNGVQGDNTFSAFGSTSFSVS